jgi:Arc/MetJ family transcription regulator
LPDLIATAGHLVWHHLMLRLGIHSPDQEEWPAKFVIPAQAGMTGTRRAVCGLPGMDMSSSSTSAGCLLTLIANQVHFQEEPKMRTTLALDDDLLAKAQMLTGLSEKTALLREALQALIQRESAKRLALLGGSEPELNDIPRRRAKTA